VEEDVRPGDRAEDPDDLLFVLLDEGVRDPEEEVAVLARDDAAAEEGEDDLLREVEPLRADLAPLEVEEDLAARPEEVRDRLLVLEARVDERVPLEVLEREPRAARAGRRGPERAVELLGAVGRRVGVLRPGEAELLAARRLQELLPLLRERFRVQAVERA
jgi:hypothetical protein